MKRTSLYLFLLITAFVYQPVLCFADGEPGETEPEDNNIVITVNDEEGDEEGDENDDKTVARRLAPGYTYTADSVRYIYDHDKRLAASDNNGLLCGYLYDADGERSLKINVLASNLLVNSQASSSSYGMDYTIYVNPYMVWQMGGVYTKHYYIGGERFLSSLGNGNTISNPKTVAAAELSLINAKRSQQEARLAEFLSIFGVPLNGIQSLGSEQVSPSATLANTSAVQSDMTAGRLQYYYHADHLGSTGYITGLDGTVLQHVEYIPGGEGCIKIFRGL